MDNIWTTSRLLSFVKENMENPKALAAVGMNKTDAKAFVSSFGKEVKI